MKIHPLDTVEVRADGHKYALRAIAPGESVIKYGHPIGRAARAIAAGDLTHSHNLESALCAADGAEAFEWRGAPPAPPRAADCGGFFMGFPRKDGAFGARDDIWIIPTVGCVNGLARALADAANAGRTAQRALALCHPYGCSQLGADHEATADALAALCRNPNAAGVLALGLGCENNTMESFRARLGDCADLNIRFMSAQEADDETAEGLALIGELRAAAPRMRVRAPLSALCVGMKCGGSDGFSGLTANPLAGRFTDWLTARGASAVLTETPEMFGAETLLLGRCATREVFEKCAAMIRCFRDYYTAHGLPVSENPSPGNKAGGITTLEEKSLGCVQKGGAARVEDVLPYAGRVRRAGLTLLAAPGNDLVSSTALAAAGCQIVVFTTGRGTPFGTAVPTVKAASNTALARKKPHWIDWDAMAAPDEEEFAQFVLRVASGEILAKNEVSGNREIALFKNGVTL